tara:strand:+ start:226 stop:606 length:381 start_codon:yes stop_codon:yes gene_type:complete
MANELKIGMSLSFSKGSVGTQKSENFSVDVTGEAYAAGTVTLANATALDISATTATVTNVGYVYLKCVSADTGSTIMTFGPLATCLAGSLKQGEACLLRWPASEANLFVKSSAAEGLLLEYCFVEE